LRDEASCDYLEGVLKMGEELTKLDQSLPRELLSYAQFHPHIHELIREDFQSHILKLLE